MFVYITVSCNLKFCVVYNSLLKCLRPSVRVKTGEIGNFEWRANTVVNRNEVNEVNETPSHANGKT
jgi:hypothetical protein